MLGKVTNILNLKKKETQRKKPSDPSFLSAENKAALQQWNRSDHGDGANQADIVMTKKLIGNEYLFLFNR